jgi:uncharacterized circularly permuted ATP-grasp superfamily protein
VAERNAARPDRTKASRGRRPVSSIWDHLRRVWRGVGHRTPDPFDIIPRIIPAQEWKGLEAGLRQRVKALNAFIHDIYNEQEILRAGRIPAEQVINNAQYRPR